MLPRDPVMCLLLCHRGWKKPRGGRRKRDRVSIFICSQLGKLLGRWLVGTLCTFPSPQRAAGGHTFSYLRVYKTSLKGFLQNADSQATPPQIPIQKVQVGLGLCVFNKHPVDVKESKQTGESGRAESPFLLCSFTRWVSFSQSFSLSEPKPANWKNGSQLSTTSQNGES